jgi:hypothetical protein
VAEPVRIPRGGVLVKHGSGLLAEAATGLGRSFFPLCALVIVAGAAVWGPWVSLALAYGLWRLVARVG